MTPHWCFPALVRRSLGSLRKPWSDKPTVLGRRYACSNPETDLLPRALFPTYTVMLERDPELQGTHQHFVHYRDGVLLRPSDGRFAGLEVLAKASHGT